jgi:inositol-phosphate phosphatase / L-galactose 1-phosphate phosphatase / histidinol-phosphatase
VLYSAQEWPKAPAQTRIEQRNSPADGSSEWMWVLDPIDGTKAFITGKPSWGTLIALLHNGRPVLGIIDQPITQERWIGVEGKQSVLNGKPIKTRKCNEVESAYMYTTTPDMFTGASESAYNRLRKAVFSTSFGADCYGYGLLAAGFVDVVAEADLKPWDYMAMVPIITGAGGVITDWNDNPLTWNTDKESDSITAWSGEVLAAGSPVLHAECLKQLDFTLSNPNH